MGFLGVYRAIYDYTPQADNELAIQSGDLLYVLEKNGDDGWWRAKKKAGADDEDEPSGLVPNNYVQEAEMLSRARAIYEYTRQTDEELSFSEDVVLDVFDTSDPDWILVGLDGEFGFVPANYIEIQEVGATEEPQPASPPPNLPARPQPQVPTTEKNVTPSKSEGLVNPAAAIASVMQSRDVPQGSESQVQSQSQPLRELAREDSEASDDEPVQSPTLPSRPRPLSQATYRPTMARSSGIEPIEESSRDNRHISGRFHLYNINEMVSIMGKKKKMPTTLGINLGTGTILIAPEGGYPGPDQEWTAEKMTHYSREGKHVFMELVRPSKSIDFHAGAKDTAEEIVAALGELAGAARAEGLKEVIMAGSQRRDKKGVILYDFMAQGEDEVTVAAGDDVIIIDDSRSEEWWQVRRLKSGKEGVVPSSYIELTGTITPPPSQTLPSATNPNPILAKSTIEQNRQEEIRLTKEAIKASKEPQQVGSLGWLFFVEVANEYGQQRSQRDNVRSDRNGQSKAKAKPDASKVRTWTDRSKSFSVDAQFLGLKDGKIHLHKMNGVKIAVPIAKMSREDLEYVEDLTGISLDDERPLADVKKSRSSDQKPPIRVGATIQKTVSQPEYDWFQFFLSCDVAVGLCERYAQAFTRDSMDESVLPDVEPSVLRNLGLREGDIIKVMRTLDAKFGRDRSIKASSQGEGEVGTGGLFSGPGGALRNNTRKGRPAPTVRTSDVVDAAAFSTKETGSGSDGVKSPLASPIKTSEAPLAGFDDDAWDVKPSKKDQQQRASQGSKSPSAPVVPVAGIAPSSAPITPVLTGSMQELSLLTAPLQPNKVGSSTQSQPQDILNVDAGEVEGPAAATSQQLPVASPGFFLSVAQASPKSLAQQRPVAPSMASPAPGSLVQLPPQRPLSAPQAILQQGMFSPPALTPQLTGIVQGQVAPLGQSLHDLSQARLRQQHSAQLQQMQPMLTGYAGMQPQNMAAFPTNTPTQFIQPILSGAPGMSPFANPRGPNQFSPMQAQPTGFLSGFPQPGFPQPAPGSINSYLSPPLEPQRTGMPTVQPQQTGVASGFGMGMQAQPLMPQKTGPPPPVRFGVTPEAKKLAPQPTGRRANLAQATPQNPFGF